MADNDEVSTTELERKIIKQIEYYFGDINMLKDKLLKQKVKEDDGWVKMDVMMKFNRLKQLSDDPAAIVQAIKKSSSGLMEVSEEGELKIRRNPERTFGTDTKTLKENLLSRSIYAKSFPIESTLDDIEIFFEQYGPIDNVYMKKDFQTKLFKGSIFVTFKNKEDMEVFLAEEDTTFSDKKLDAKMTKADYIKKKQDERRSKQRKEDATKRAEEKKNPPPLPDLSAGEEDEKVRNQMTKGAVLSLKEMDPETNTRESVKELFAKHGDVAWVDFDKGVSQGYIRLREPNSAGLALESLKDEFDNGDILLNNKKIEVCLVEGDEEFQYWKKMFRDIYERNRKGRENRRHNKKRDDRRSGGGRKDRNRNRDRGSKRKRGGGAFDDDDDGFSPYDDFNAGAKMGRMGPMGMGAMGMGDFSGYY